MLFRTYTDEELGIDETLDEKEIVKRIRAKLLEDHKREHDYAFGQPNLEVLNDPTERVLGNVDLDQEIKELPKQNQGFHEVNSHNSSSYSSNENLKPAHNILTCSCNCGKLLQARLGFISYEEVFSDNSNDLGYSSTNVKYQPNTLTFKQASNYDTSTQSHTYATGGYF